MLGKIPHFPIENFWDKEIPPYKFLFNCRNCGASAIKDGKCEYCGTSY